MKTHLHLGKEEYNSEKTTTEGTCEDKPLLSHVTTGLRVRTLPQEAKGCSTESSRTDMTTTTSTMIDREITTGNKIEAAVATATIGTETIRDKTTGTTIIKIGIRATTTAINQEEAHPVTDEMEASVRTTHTHQTKTDNQDSTKTDNRMEYATTISAMGTTPSVVTRHAE